jgi:parallel beta-helix repeat protein
LGFEWLMLAAACDDGHVVGEPIATGGKAGSQAGATTVGGMPTTAESTAAGGAPLLGTGGYVPTTGGAVASGGATSLAAGGAVLTGGATSTGESVPACVVHVTTSGNDSNDGRHWSSAFANVQPAIDTGTQLVSTGACTAVEIWVAVGTYKPTYLDDSTDARTATFQLATNVALYGGFAGTESKRSDRSIDRHVTILSGDIGTQDETKDNSYHVVTGETGATLDGFTVTGGNSDAPYTFNPDRDASTDNTKSYGGGMLNDGASPTVANCTFVNNSARDGGGMYNSNSSPTVTDCVFTKNYPGGMYNDDSSPTVRNCTFSQNSGGGMNNMRSSPTVTNCLFKGNSGKIWASGGYGGETEGGGMYNVLSSPTLTNCVFTDNTVSMGGSFVGFGGGMYNSSSSPMLINCTFTNNSGEHGGGIYSYEGSPIAINCIFWGDANETGVSEIEPQDSVAMGHSIVQGGYAAGTNIITSDPLFVGPANGDLRLSAGSPAIDSGGCASGLAATDILGNPRWNMTSVPDGPAGNGVDIGAHEHQGTAGTDAIVTNLCP